MLKKTIKVIRKIVSGLILLVGVAILSFGAVCYYYGHEPLDKEVVYWHDYFNKIKEKIDLKENGSVYLIGFYANENEDPYQVGLQRIENYNKTLNDWHWDYSQDPSIFPITPYPDDKRIKVASLQLQPENAECSLTRGRQSCVASLLSDKTKLEKLVNDNKLLIDRYWKLTEYKKFTFTHQPSILETDTVFGKSAYFRAAHRLAMYQLLLTLDKGETKKVAEKLQQAIANTRLILISNDWIVNQLVALQNLSDELTVVEALIVKDPDVAQVLVNSLIPINKEEASFQLKSVMQSVYNLDQTVNYIGKYTYSNSPWYKRPVTIFQFQSNMTTNELFRLQLNKNYAVRHGFYNVTGFRLIGHFGRFLPKYLVGFDSANGDVVYNIGARMHLLQIYLKQYAGQMVDLKEPHSQKIPFTVDNKLCYTSIIEGQANVCTIQFTKSDPQMSTSAPNGTSYSAQFFNNGLFSYNNYVVAMKDKNKKGLYMTRKMGTELDKLQLYQQLEGTPRDNFLTEYHKALLQFPRLAKEIDWNKMPAGFIWRHGQYTEDYSLLQLSLIYPELNDIKALDTFCQQEYARSNFLDSTDQYNQQLADICLKVSFSLKMF